MPGLRWIADSGSSSPRGVAQSFATSAIPARQPRPQGGNTGRPAQGPRRERKRFLGKETGLNKSSTIRVGLSLAITLGVLALLDAGIALLPTRANTQAEKRPAEVWSVGYFTPIGSG